MAMPNKVKVFPRGYSGGQSPTKQNFTIRGGDSEVTKLWEQYTSPVNNSTRWSYRKKVIAVAKRLLSGTSNWFILQDTNPWVVDYNYQFLIDTLRFIGTGRRRINIHTWKVLVSHAPTGGLANVEERHDIADAFQALKLSTSVDALIQLWCSQPNGFDDLVNTLNIWFGDLSIRDTTTQVDN